MLPASVRIGRCQWPPHLTSSSAIDGAPFLPCYVATRFPAQQLAQRFGRRTAITLIEVDRTGNQRLRGQRCAPRHSQEHLARILHIRARRLQIEYGSCYLCTRHILLELHGGRTRSRIRHPRLRPIGSSPQRLAAVNSNRTVNRQQVGIYATRREKAQQSDICHFVNLTRSLYPNTLLNPCKNGLRRRDSRLFARSMGSILLLTLPRG